MGYQQIGDVLGVVIDDVTLNRVRALLGANSRS